MLSTTMTLLAQGAELVQRTEGDAIRLTVLEWILAVVGGIVLLVLGYKVGRWLENAASRKLIAQKEEELFTAQKGFRNLYESELGAAKSEADQLREQVQRLETKVEDYRKKAAGLGGLFSSGGKRADAMYALLLENEALEEALFAQNEKLRQERTDAIKEQLRATGYRRVLMSQLLNDNRIKEYVAEILADEKHLPPPPHGQPTNQRALPPQPQQQHASSSGRDGAGAHEGEES